MPADAPDDPVVQEHVPSTLVQLFGDHAVLHVLDTLLDHPTRAYTKAALADASRIDHAELDAHWPRLQRFDLIEPAGEDDRGQQRYRLNHDAALAEHIARFEAQLRDDPATRELLDP